MTLQGKARLKIWLALLSVFALGAMTGGALDRVHCMRSQHGARGRHEGRADRFFQELQNDLALTDEQSNSVRRIIDETRNEYHMLRQEVRPRYDAIRQRERAEIRALLSVEQQQQFDQLTERIDARHRKHGD